jgi:hypothetical protein
LFPLAWNGSRVSGCSATGIERVKRR